MPDNLKNFWQTNVDEIKDNKSRFMAIIALFVISVILLLNDFANDEEVALNVTPNENINTIEPIQNINVDDNITAVIGANSETLYVQDPFEVEEKIELEPMPLPELQPVNLPQMASLPPPPFWKSNLSPPKNLSCEALLLSAKINPHSFKKLHQIRPKII